MLPYPVFECCRSKTGFLFFWGNERGYPTDTATVIRKCTHKNHTGRVLGYIIWAVIYFYAKLLKVNYLPQKPFSPFVNNFQKKQNFVCRL